jgi:cereblon
MVLLNISLTDPKVIETIDGNDEAFLCAVCKTKISEKKYLTSIQGDSPYRTFTNPHGFEFKILTVLYCEMILDLSGEYNDFTWFSGYAWAIIGCSSCREHIGWRYVSTEKEPHAFYGLIRDKLIISLE